MASKKSRKPNRSKKKLKKTLFKKQKQEEDQNTNQASPCTSQQSDVVSSTTSFPLLQDPSYSPSTPKANKFRIPEMLTCPPAPKKQRISQNTVLRRRHISFFAPPEIELFFVNAHDR